MRINLKGIACALAAAILLPANAAGEGEVHLVDKMTALGYFTHKVGLSLAADNLELADFYLHEMEEVSAEVAAIPEYDGQPVGQLSAAMLLPILNELAEAVDSGSADSARAAYGKVIDSCNACHVATTFGYIKVTDRSDYNPYGQDFSP